MAGSEEPSEEGHDEGRDADFEGNKRRIVRMVDYEESVVNGNLGDEG